LLYTFYMFRFLVVTLLRVSHRHGVGRRSTYRTRSGKTKWRAYRPAIYLDTLWWHQTRILRC